MGRRISIKVVKKSMHTLIWIVAIGCLLSLSTNCSTSTKIEATDGIYRSDDGYYLSFTNDKWYYYVNEPNGVSSYYCCDTISYGTYKPVDGFGIALNSPEKFSPFYPLEVEVRETIKDRDQFQFRVLSPLSLDDLNSTNVKRVKYSLEISTETYDFLEALPRGERSENVFVAQRKGDVVLKDFRVIATITDEFWPHSIGRVTVFTEKYAVNNSMSNVFDIKIPDLTGTTFTHLYQNDEFVKVENSRKIRWNGRLFTKIED